jgi:hypothetical protein
MGADIAKADRTIQVSLAEIFIQPAASQFVIRHCFSRKNRLLAGGVMVTLFMPLLVVTMPPKLLQFDVVILPLL